MAINNLIISNRGLALIKKHEGLRLGAYYCPAGKLTIGYGHRVKKHEHLIKITLEQAEALLIEDCALAQIYIRSAVTVPLNQHQFDALVSFVFNLGTEALRKSTLLKLLNAGNYSAAATQILRFKYVRNPRTGRPEESKGLVNRRTDEFNLFLEAL